MTKEAKIICSKMSTDFKHFEKLKAEYPDNFINTRYEDQVRDPVTVAVQLYEHIGKVPISLLIVLRSKSIRVYLLKSFAKIIKGDPVVFWEKVYRRLEKRTVRIEIN